jgi:hypothetical protein
VSFKPYKAPAGYATTKEVVQRFIDDAGGVKPAAFVLERKERAVYDYCDRDIDTQITFDQVRRLTVATHSTVAAEALAADAGGVFVPGEVDDAAFAELAAQVCGEHGQFSSELCRAFGDGQIDDSEKPVMRRELDDLIRAAVAARVRLDAAGDFLRPAPPVKPPRRKR